MRVVTTINLRGLRDLDDAMVRGLSDGAEFILEESQREVPIEEAVLEGSGAVTIDPGRTEVKATISYDGPYAVAQHERTDYRHDEGRKAKFLEDPMKAHSPAAFDRVGDEMRRADR